MENSNEIPCFTLYITEPSKHYSWCIVLDGEVVLHIQNFMSFCRALKYPCLVPKVLSSKDQMIKDTNLLKESIKKEFGSKNGIGSEVCLQNKITEYLIKNSEQSRKNFGRYYISLLGECKSFSISDSKSCINCSMRPN